jgi:uncharacterized membrane protein YbhN (UPF0104 family)
VVLHTLFNNLLPMRSGEASFPILMKGEFGVPFARSVAGLLYLRLLDLHFILLLGAVFLLGESGPGGWLLVAFLGPIPFVAFLLQGFFHTPSGNGEAASQRPSAVSGGRLRRVIRTAIGGLPRTPRLFWMTWVWTGVNWSAKLLVFAWILQAFSPMPYSTALLGSVTGELSSVLPFHGLAGAGTYEAGVLASLLPRGIPLEDAVRSAVSLHLFLLGTSALSGLMVLLVPAGRARKG